MRGILEEIDGIELYPGQTPVEGVLYSLGEVVCRSACHMNLEICRFVISRTAETTLQDPILAPSSY